MQIVRDNIQIILQGQNPQSPSFNLPEDTVRNIVALLPFLTAYLLQTNLDLDRFILHPFVKFVLIEFWWKRGKQRPMGARQGGDAIGVWAVAYAYTLVQFLI